MYLIDTCALLWFLDDNPKLSEKAKDLISKSNDLHLSIASLWEISIKRRFINLILKKALLT